jgi:hypothetical protein
MLPRRAAQGRSRLSNGSLASGNDWRQEPAAIARPNVSASFGQTSDGTSASILDRLTVTAPLKQRLATLEAVKIRAAVSYETVRRWVNLSDP